MNTHTELPTTWAEANEERAALLQAWKEGLDQATEGFLVTLVKARATGATVADLVAITGLSSKSIEQSLAQVAEAMNLGDFDPYRDIIMLDAKAETTETPERGEPDQTPGP